VATTCTVEKETFVGFFVVGDTGRMSSTDPIKVKSRNPWELRIPENAVGCVFWDIIAGVANGHRIESAPINYSRDTYFNAEIMTLEEAKSRYPDEDLSWFEGIGSTHIIRYRDGGMDSYDPRWSYRIVTL
jgi:hypothetical protein